MGKARSKGTVYTRHQSKACTRAVRSYPVTRHLVTQTSGSGRWIQEVVLGVGAGAGATQGVLGHVHTLGNRRACASQVDVVYRQRRQRERDDRDIDVLGES